MAQIVKTHGISMKNAWCMTLREYTMLVKCEKAKAITSTYDRSDLEDILASFEVKSL